MKKIAQIVFVFMVCIVLVSCDSGDLDIQSPIPSYSEKNKVNVEKNMQDTYMNKIVDELNEDENVIHSVSLMNIILTSQFNDEMMYFDQRSKGTTYFYIAKDLEDVKMSSYHQYLLTMSYEGETINEGGFYEQYIQGDTFYFSFTEDSEMGKTQIKIPNIYDEDYSKQSFAEELLSYKSDLLNVIPKSSDNVEMDWYKVNDQTIAVYELDQALRKRYFDNMFELLESFSQEIEIDYEKLTIIVSLLFDSKDEVSAIELLFDGFFEVSINDIPATDEDEEDIFIMSFEYRNSVEIYYFNSTMPDQPDFSNYITFDEYFEKQKENNKDEED